MIVGIKEQKEVRETARARIKTINFGDEVTNICAGQQNPRRLAYFVGYAHDFCKCTDKKGKFWDVNIDVIFPGHLEYPECNKLFHPIWQANYK